MRVRASAFRCSNPAPFGGFGVLARHRADRPGREAVDDPRAKFGCAASCVGREFLGLLELLEQGAQLAHLLNRETRDRKVTYLYALDVGAREGAARLRGAEE